MKEKNCKLEEMQRTKEKERNGGRDPAVRPNHIHQTHKTLGKSCFPNTNVSNT